jgi:nicotinamidase-related amidase
MLLDAEDSQLVLIDYQVRLMPAIHDNAAVVRNAVRLGTMAKWMDVPTWGTEENSAAVGENLAEVRVLCSRTLAKMHFNSCADGLVEWLRPASPQALVGNARSLPKHLQKVAPSVAQRNTIVMGGCEAHVCLMQTALDLLDKEFDVCVVTDACGSRTERNRDAAFDRLASAGAELVTTEMVAFEWLRSAEHPRFKDVLALVK